MVILLISLPILIRFYNPAQGYLYFFFGSLSGYFSVSIFELNKTMGLPFITTVNNLLFWLFSNLKHSFFDPIELETPNFLKKYYCNSLPHHVMLHSKCILASCALFKPLLAEVVKF